MLTLSFQFSGKESALPSRKRHITGRLRPITQPSRRKHAEKSIVAQVSLIHRRVRGWANTYCSRKHAMGLLAITPRSYPASVTHSKLRRYNESRSVFRAAAYPACYRSQQVVPQQVSVPVSKCSSFIQESNQDRGNSVRFLCMYKKRKMMCAQLEQVVMNCVTHCKIQHTIGQPPDKRLQEPHTNNTNTVLLHAHLIALWMPIKLSWLDTSVQRLLVLPLPKKLNHPTLVEYCPHTSMCCYIHSQYLRELSLQAVFLTCAIGTHNAPGQASPLVMPSCSGPVASN